MLSCEDSEKLCGTLVDKSLDAYVMALETINRLSIKYRLEAFLFLICNAWELLLKGKVLKDSKDVKALYYDDSRTHDLRYCLRTQFGDNDPIRRNIARVAGLRDNATHLVLSELPRTVMGVFQSCVLNYHKCAKHWFDVDLSERVSVGMMTIVYDLAPQCAELGVVLKRSLDSQQAEYLSQLCAELHQEYEALGKPAEFMVEICYRVTIVKAPKDSDVSLTSGGDGQATRVVEVPKDPGRTHPFRQKDALEEINRILAERGYQPARKIIARVQKKFRYPKIVNEGDIQKMCKTHALRKRPEFFYRGTIAGSPGQYSQAFVDWFLRQVESHPQLFQFKHPDVASLGRGPGK